MLDNKLRERVDDMFDTMMKDDEKGKLLTKAGEYIERKLSDKKMNSQEYFYEQAYIAAGK